MTAPAECPVCGADVPRGAKACPGCGADERTGWDEEKTRYDALDLPEEAYGESKPAAGSRRSARIAQGFWWVVGVVVLVALIFFTVGF